MREGGEQGGGEGGRKGQEGLDVWYAVEGLSPTFYDTGHQWRDVWSACVAVASLSSLVFFPICLFVCF